MPITDNEALTRTIEHREIFHDEMLTLMRRIMSGDMSPVMAAALLIGLRVKKETIGEITAAAQVMREFSVKVPLGPKPHLVDVVGTGGDGAHTFNISTCSMFVAAAAGAPNILMGVFHPDLVGIQVRALQRLGAEHALVVYGRDGMDEVSLGAATLVGELKDGQISEYEIHPEDFGLPMASNRALKVETPEQSRLMLMNVLDNQPGPARDIVVFNAGAALYAGNVASSIADGIAKARAVLESGAAKAKLEQLVRVSKSLAG